MRTGIAVAVLFPIQFYLLEWHDRDSFGWAPFWAAPFWRYCLGCSWDFSRMSRSARSFPSQWDTNLGVAPNLVPRPGVNRGSVALRGRVSCGTSVSVMIGWLDDRQRNVGFKSFRLPDGEWSDAVTLEVGAELQFHGPVLVEVAVHRANVWRQHRKLSASEKGAAFPALRLRASRAHRTLPRP